MKLIDAPTFPPIRIGLKVRTPKGEGTINYARLALPGYERWFSASVKLADSEGTIFWAEEIEVLEEW